MTHWRLSRRALIAGAALSLAAPAAAPAAANDDVSERETIRVNGTARRYRFVRPQNLPPSPPLVLAFHGVGDNPGNMARYSGLDAAARQYGWLLAYPRANGGRWPYYSASVAAREVDFIAALIGDLIARHGADPNRIHLTGFSGGAYFINVVAARLSERIASICAHSGGAGGLAISGVNAARKYPVLVIHGDADRSVPVEEGRLLAQQYEREGHRVDYWEVPGLIHDWAPGANERLHAFFAAHPLT